MYLFCNDYIPPINLDGNKNNIFNHNKFYRAIHWIITGFNGAAKEKNGSDIMIYAEGAILALPKLKNWITEGSSFVADICTSWSNFPHACILHKSSRKITTTLQVY